MPNTKPPSTLPKTSEEPSQPTVQIPLLTHANALNHVFPPKAPVTCGAQPGSPPAPLSHLLLHQQLFTAGVSPSNYLRHGVKDPSAQSPRLAALLRTLPGLAVCLGREASTLASWCPSHAAAFPGGGKDGPQGCGPARRAQRLSASPPLQQGAHAQPFTTGPPPRLRAPQQNIASCSTSAAQGEILTVARGSFAGARQWGNPRRADPSSPP